MEHPINPKNRPSKITELVKNLSTNLSTLSPNTSETTKIITYALLATAVVGISIYHYIKDQELKENG